MDILDQLHLSHWADASERLRLVNLAADEIERLREALQHILTHCKSDKPPNAQALILFANNALGEKE